MAESLSREHIYGRRVWSLLHTTAAYFPKQPSDHDKEQAKIFVEGLLNDALEYPKWSENIELDSLDVSSNNAFATWVCVQHNRVNAKLSKQEFSCEIEDLKKRWGGLKWFWSFKILSQEAACKHVSDSANAHDYQL